MIFGLFILDDEVILFDELSLVDIVLWVLVFELLLFLADIEDDILFNIIIDI